MSGVIKHLILSSYIITFPFVKINIIFDTFFQKHDILNPLLLHFPTFFKKSHTLIPYTKCKRSEPIAKSITCKLLAKEEGQSEKRASSHPDTVILRSIGLSVILSNAKDPIESAPIYGILRWRSEWQIACFLEIKPSPRGEGVSVSWRMRCYSQKVLLVNFLRKRRDRAKKEQNTVRWIAT